ncbi:hypothetical protein E3N88_09467 [Mikania micrantha]|uniref:Uncharacterized protein n=1 Tax=Mikania micrantha TaxID=192012 RepID=A0A5N6PL37_9ASTR|nr:hypothetical protein E3N88_09467 [Mikania micrantha]
MPAAQGETLIAVAAPTGTTQIWSTNSKGCKTLIHEQQTNSLTPLIFFFIFFPAIAFSMCSTVYPKKGEIGFVMKNVFEWGDARIGTRGHTINEVNCCVKSKVPEFLWDMRLGQ